MTGCGGSPPRDPDKFVRTNHFVEDAMTSKYRFLTEKMVEETIRDGVDCDRIEAGAGNLRRKKTYGGVNAVLVMPENQPLIITGWTEINDLIVAMQSDRWTQQQIEAMRAFCDLEHKTAGPRYNVDEDKKKPDWNTLRLS